MEKITIGFDIGTNNPAAGLGIRVRLDAAVVYENASVTDTVKFAHEISDEEGQHQLQIELFGKLPTHTKINSAGEITEDALLTVDNIVMDGIDVSIMSMGLSRYSHDCNGTQALADHEFFGPMGCNGTVTLNFTTPIYLWLLENM